MQKAFGADAKCSNTKNSRRSPIFFEMRQLIMNYYESKSEYSNYDWIHEIMNITNEHNKFLIHGDLRNFDKNENNKNIKLVLVASRYVDDKCRYRCIANGRNLRDTLISQIFDELPDEFIILYGNPGILSFHGQYNLFKRCKVFIGVHGAVFLISSLFMAPNSLKFEITIKGGGGGEMSSRDVVGFFDKDSKSSYRKYYCDYCKIKHGLQPSDIKINELLPEFREGLLCVVYDQC